MRISKRIIGIDPGTARLGWGVIEVAASTGFTPRAVAYGCIETKKGDEPHRRLQQIRRELKELLREFAPDRAVVERLFFATNQKTAMSTAEARGIVLAELAEANIPYWEQTPLQLKVAICGNGQADKKQVQFMVKELLQLDALPRPDDAADGLALALAVAHHIDL